MSNAFPFRYVKVYLNSTSRSLGKKKTKAKKNTLNPEFDEIVVVSITC